MAKDEYSNDLSDWYCGSLCLNQQASVCAAADPVARFMCTCNNHILGLSVNTTEAAEDHYEDRWCGSVRPRSEFRSTLSQWYCSMKCLYQSERDCHADVVSKIVCHCHHITDRRGRHSEDDDDGVSRKIVLNVGERDNYSYSSISDNKDFIPRPIVVDVLERYSYTKNYELRHLQDP